MRYTEGNPREKIFHLNGLFFFENTAGISIDREYEMIRLL
jgi:hypothetical protein